jgi:hypothetical protein
MSWNFVLETIDQCKTVFAITNHNLKGYANEQKRNKKNRTQTEKHKKVSTISQPYRRIPSLCGVFHTIIRMTRIETQNGIA